MIDSKLASIRELPPLPEKNFSHIPGESGWPIIGNTFSFIRNAPALMEKAQARHGNLFYINMFGSRAITFADPDDVAMILKDSEENFSSSKGWFRMSGLFDGGILVRDFNDHKPHRKILQKAFQQSEMNNYANGLNRLIADELDNWDSLGDFLFMPKIKSLLLDNAAALFLGADLGDESQLLNQAFVDLLDGLMVTSRSKRKNSAWQKSQRGKEFLRGWLGDRVEERMHGNGQDFFSSLCRESRNPEHPMDTENIIDHTLLLLFAAHDTTTSTLSNIMSLLCEHPEWQEKLRSEVKLYRDTKISKTQTTALSMDDLPHLGHCDRVFKETMRLYPPVFLIPRRAIDSFEHQGKVIPKNAAIHLSVYLIHRSKQYWTNPDKFDPERFSPERNEHRQHRFQYIPFGAGAHTCLGLRFAEAQSKIFLYEFLNRYRATSKPGRSLAMQTVPIPIPKDKLPLRLHRI